MVPYLVRLTSRISQGLGGFAGSWRKQQADFIRAQQQPDGGFRGREGSGDLYYTSFALRSLAVLGELDTVTVERVGAFLRDRTAGKAAIVDFFSLIYSVSLLEIATGSDVLSDVPSNWRTNVATALESLRRDDGGYAKTEEGAASSTYHTFLALVCLELLEQPVPEPQQVVKFLQSQRSPEGGFREIRVQKRAATNPTAAAMAVFHILGAVDKELEHETADFLSEMQTDEGGLRANTRIPIADLLSTFTGLLTLEQIGAVNRIDVSAALRYVKSLENERGGFRGAAWDSVEDVEYTFYGLGSLALLADH